MTSHDEAEAQRLGLVFLDQAFERARAVLGDGVPCRRGCSSCCESAAVFEIHVADAAVLAAGLQRLEPAVREEVLRRAAATLAEATSVAEELAAAGETCFQGWDPAAGLAFIPARAVERLASRVPGACPVLGASSDGLGECLLHAWRPAICRLQGVPWHDPATGAALPDFCRLDSRQATNPAQPLDLAALDEGREASRIRLEATGECGRSLPTGRTFVAEAVVRAGAARPCG